MGKTSGWGFRRRRLCPSSRFLQLRFSSSNSTKEWNLKNAITRWFLTFQLKKIKATQHKHKQKTHIGFRNTPYIVPLRNYNQAHTYVSISIHTKGLNDKIIDDSARFFQHLRTEFSPAALLAEPLFVTCNCNPWGLWMELTNLVAPVIVPAFAEVWFAPVNKARRD